MTFEASLLDEPGRSEATGKTTAKAARRERRAQAKPEGDQPAPTLQAQLHRTCERQRALQHAAAHARDLVHLSAATPKGGKERAARAHDDHGPERQHGHGCAADAGTAHAADVIGTPALAVAEPAAPPVPARADSAVEPAPVAPVEAASAPALTEGLRRVAIADDAGLLLAMHSARLILDVGAADPLTVVLRMRGGLTDVRALGPAAEALATGEASLKKSLGEQGLNLGSFSAHDDRKSWAADGGREELDEHRDLFAGRGRRA